MEKVYKYYEIAASEDPYRVRSNTVAQNNCYLRAITLLLRALS